MTAFQTIDGFREVTLLYMWGFLEVQVRGRELPIETPASSESAFADESRDSSHCSISIRSSLDLSTTAFSLQSEESSSRPCSISEESDGAQEGEEATESQQREQRDNTPIPSVRSSTHDNAVGSAGADEAQENRGDGESGEARALEGGGEWTTYERPSAKNRRKLRLERSANLESEQRVEAGSAARNAAGVRLSPPPTVARDVQIVSRLFSTSSAAPSEGGAGDAAAAEATVEAVAEAAEAAQAARESQLEAAVAAARSAADQASGQRLLAVLLQSETQSLTDALHARDAQLAATQQHVRELEAAAAAAAARERALLRALEEARRQTQTQAHAAAAAAAVSRTTSSSLWLPGGGLGGTSELCSQRPFAVARTHSHGHLMDVAQGHGMVEGMEHPGVMSQGTTAVTQATRPSADLWKKAAADLAAIGGGSRRPAASFVEHPPHEAHRRSVSGSDALGNMGASTWARRFGGLSELHAVSSASSVSSSTRDHNLTLSPGRYFLPPAELDSSTYWSSSSDLERDGGRPGRLSRRSHSESNLQQVFAQRQLMSTLFGDNTPVGSLDLEELAPMAAMERAAEMLRTSSVAEVTDGADCDYHYSRLSAEASEGGGGEGGGAGGVEGAAMRGMSEPRGSFEEVEEEEEEAVAWRDEEAFGGACELWSECTQGFWAQQMSLAELSQSSALAASSAGMLSAQGLSSVVEGLRSSSRTSASGDWYRV